MTMENYLINPVGHKSASVARRDIIIANLEGRYRKMRREIKFGWKVDVFMSSFDGCYYFKFKIPSEEIEKLFYDVVIKFNPPEAKKRYLTLNQYNIQLFSNAANFTFTYAYIFNLQNLLIPELKYKLSQKSLNDPPKKRNPQEDIGFEKSVYYALLYMKELEIHKFKSIRNPIPYKKEYIQNVSSFDVKFKEQKRLKENLQNRNKNKMKIKKVTAKGVSSIKKFSKDVKKNMTSLTKPSQKKKINKNTNKKKSNVF